MICGLSPLFRLFITKQICCFKQYIKGMRNRFEYSRLVLYFKFEIQPL